MRKLVTLIIVGLFAASASYASVGLSFGLAGGDLSGGNGSIPIIGVPIELNKKVIIEPHIGFSDFGIFNGTLVEQRNHFVIGTKALFRLTEKETHPYVGGMISYGPQSIEIESGGSIQKQTSSSFGVAGIFGIEHNVSSNFTVALESSLGYTSKSDIEVNNIKAVDGYSNIGLGIALIFRMFLD